jgi:hypothetical protein
MPEFLDPSHTLLCFKATPAAPGRKKFGYLANKGLTQPVFTPLEWPGGVISVSVGAQPDGQTPVGEVPESPVRAQETEGTSNLQSVIALLQASGTTKVTVDPALSDRPISLFGRGNAPPEQVLAALAAVSGLRVVTPGGGDGKERRLTRRALRTASGPAEFPAAVRSALPVPLLRALHESHEGDDNSGGRRPSDPNPRAAADALRSEAARRLQSLVGPVLERLPNGGSDGVPVASRDATERSLFALAALYQFLSALSIQMTDPAPEYITRFEEGYVTGGPYQDRGKTKLHVSFGMWDPQTNSVREQIGIWGIEPAPAGQ